MTTPGRKSTQKRAIPPKPEPLRLRSWQVVLGVLAVAGAGAWMMASPAVTHRRFDSQIWGFVITAIALAFAGVWFFGPVTTKPPRRAYAYDRAEMRRVAGQILKAVTIGCMVVIALLLIGASLLAVRLAPELGRWGERNDTLIGVAFLFAAMLGGVGAALYWQKPLMRWAVAYARLRAFSWRVVGE
jgi:hypothetical protein